MDTTSTDAGLGGLFDDLVPSASGASSVSAAPQGEEGAVSNLFHDLIPSSEAKPVEKESGLWNNLTAGANEALYSTLGAPVDAAAFVLNKLADQARAISGAPVQAIKNPIGGSQSIADAFSSIGVNDPKDVEPKGPLERAARATGAGAAAMVAPEAMVGALAQAGMLTPKAVQMLAPLFGDGASLANTARNATLGAVGGATGSAAGQAAEEAGYGAIAPLAELAGGLAGGIGADLAMSAPGAAARAARQAVDYVAPTTASQERVAGRILNDAASDPAAVLAADGAQLVPGSAPTTFQATGDMGLGALERAAATRDPVPFQQRRADQNSARLSALDALAPDGAPDALSRTLRGDAAAADDVAAQGVSAATARAAEDVRGLGGDQPPEVYGARMRQGVLDADSVARERERALWQAVDPDGTLTIPTAETIGTARTIVKEMPRLAAPMEGPEAAIFSAVRALDGQPLPFRELHALRSRVSDAMREELKANGKTATYARLTRLRGAIERDLEGSVLTTGENGVPAASGSSLGDTWDAPPRATAADDGWPGPTPRAARQSEAPASDAVTREAADIASGRRAPYRPPSFLRWISARGGVRPDANVEAALDAADRRAGGILATSGRTVDEWGEAIAEHAGMQQRPDQNQILDWIGEAANGREPDWWRTLYANPEREEAARIARDIQRVASEEGIQLRTRRAAQELIEQEAAPFSAKRPNAAPPEPIRPATFDASAQERLRAATDATKERARTFAPLKDVVKTRGTANDFVTPDAVVPQRVFVPGPKGQATVKSYLDAVGDEGRAPLHDYAVAALRRAAEKPDGTLDPAKVEAWRARHRDALRALPETDKALATAAQASAAVDALAASRREAMEARQAGIVGKLMALEDPQDVTRAVGAIFARQDAMREMKRLAEATAGNEDARAGLRKAVADFLNRQFISSTEAATSGAGTLKSDSFQAFVRKHERTLATVFSPEEVVSLKAIAADLQQANRSISAVRIPGQSNTAQDTAALADGRHSMLSRIARGAAGAAGWGVGGPGWGLAAFLGANALASARRAGMVKVDDLVRDALLDPALAKALMQKTVAGKASGSLTLRLLHNARIAGQTSAVRPSSNDR